MHTPEWQHKMDCPRCSACAAYSKQLHQQQDWHTRLTQRASSAALWDQRRQVGRSLRFLSGRDQGRQGMIRTGRAPSFLGMQAFFLFRCRFLSLLSMINMAGA